MGAQACAPACSGKFDKMKPISYTIPYWGTPLTSMGEGGEPMKKSAFLRVTFFLKLFCVALLALAWSLLAFSLRVVNTFPDRKLSDTDSVPAIPLLEPLAWTQVAESLLHPLRVVEALDVSEHRLPGLFPRMEMNPVNRFFFQN